jgi:hypothetical protein
VAAISFDRNSPVRFHKPMISAAVRQIMRAGNPARPPQLISRSCNCRRAGPGASSIHEPVVRISKIQRLEVA